MVDSGLLEELGREYNSWFVLPSRVEVGSRLENFIRPRVLKLMYDNMRDSELSLYVDGNRVFTFTNATARGCGLFVAACKQVVIDVEHRVHRIGFLLPNRRAGGQVLFEKYIIPYWNGESVASNNTSYQIGRFDGSYYDLECGDEEDSLFHNNSGTIVSW